MMKSVGLSWARDFRLERFRVWPNTYIYIEVYNKVSSFLDLLDRYYIDLFASVTNFLRFSPYRNKSC